jgi:hypothetical protein
MVRSIKYLDRVLFSIFNPLSPGGEYAISFTHWSARWKSNLIGERRCSIYGGIKPSLPKIGHRPAAILAAGPYFYIKTGVHVWTPVIQ